MIGAQGWNGAPAPDDIWHLSASTLGRALAKPKLESWAERETANRVVDDIEVIAGIARRSPDAARAYVKSIRYSGADDLLSAADRGTALHAYIEARLTGTSADLPTILHHLAATKSDFTLKSVPVAVEQLTPFLSGIEAWLSEYYPEPVEVEQAVYDPTHRLAGQLDFKVRLRGRFDAWPGAVDPVVLLDGKTSEKTYDSQGRPFKPYGDSHALQLVALAYATHAATWQPRLMPGQNGGRFYLANPEELATAVAPAHVDGAALLSITPAYCKAFPVDISPSVHAYALCVADAWRWAHIASKSVVGDAIDVATGRHP